MGKVEKKKATKPAPVRLSTLSPEARAEKLAAVDEVLSALLAERPYARVELAAAAEPLSGVHMLDIGARVDELVVNGEIHEVDGGLLELTETDDGPACVVCGCTEHNACAEGCGWERSAAEGGVAICTVCADFVDVLAAYLKQHGEQTFAQIARACGRGELEAKAPEDLDENRLRAILVHGAKSGRFACPSLGVFGPPPAPPKPARATTAPHEKCACGHLRFEHFRHRENCKDPSCKCKRFTLKPPAASLEPDAWALLTKLATTREGGLKRFAAEPARALRKLKLARRVQPGPRLVITIRGRERHAQGREAR